MAVCAGEGGLQFGSGCYVWCAGSAIRPTWADSSSGGVSAVVFLGAGGGLAGGFVLVAKAPCVGGCDARGGTVEACDGGDVTEEGICGVGVVGFTERSFTLWLGVCCLCGGGGNGGCIGGVALHAGFWIGYCSGDVGDQFVGPVTTGGDAEVDHAGGSCLSGVGGGSFDFARVGFGDSVCESILFDDVGCGLLH